jgi:hypothetical protein
MQSSPPDGTGPYCDSSAEVWAALLTPFCVSFHLQQDPGALLAPVYNPFLFFFLSFSPERFCSPVIEKPESSPLALLLTATLLPTPGHVFICFRVQGLVLEDRARRRYAHDLHRSLSHLS